METNFTKHNLVRKIYGELNTAQQIEMLSIQKQNSELIAAEKELLESKEALDAAMIAPPQAAVGKVLQYSFNSHKLGV